MNPLIFSLISLILVAVSANFLSLIKENKLITINSLSDNQKTTLMSLSGVKDFPMRVKCATMAWHTLSNVLEKNNENKR